MKMNKLLDMNMYHKMTSKTVKGEIAVNKCSEVKEYSLSKLEIKKIF